MGKSTTSVRSTGRVAALHGTSTTTAWCWSISVGSSQVWRNIPSGILTTCNGILNYISLSYVTQKTLDSDMYVNAGKLLQFQLGARNRYDWQYVTYAQCQRQQIKNCVEQESVTKFEPTLTWKLVELVGWWSLIAKVVEVLTLHISIAWKEKR